MPSVMFFYPPTLSLPEFSYQIDVYICSEPFYKIWTELKWTKINSSVIPKCLPDMFIMIVILVIDSLLKLTATKTKLKVFSPPCSLFYLNCNFDLP